MHLNQLCVCDWGRGRRAEQHLRILLTPRKCILVCDFRSSKDNDDDNEEKMK